MNYCQKFLHKYAQITKPLNALIFREIAKSKKKLVEWNEDCETAFQKLKILCSETPILVYADYSKPFHLQTDARKKVLGAVLYQKQDDGTMRVKAYASRTLSKSEKNYDTHKLEFVALKWPITYRFHEYLYGGNFEVFTDNNHLSYLLIMAKLDATGQRWVVSLTNYNFKLHYKSGKLNVEADALSKIPWGQEEELCILGTTAVKAIINRGYNGDSSIPEVPPGIISVIAKGLMVDSTTKLSKQDWKREQQVDSDIGPIITLINNKALLQYIANEGDSSGVRVLLKYWKDLRMKGLLYRKVLLKGHDQPIAQFVLPEPSRCKTLLACHNNFGHMGMERTLGLLQERFFWPKMAADVRETCEMYMFQVASRESRDEDNYCFISFRN